MSEKFKPDRKIGFQNTFYTKSINVTTDSIGPSIILRSIFAALIALHKTHENLFKNVNEKWFNSNFYANFHGSVTLLFLLRFS